MKCGLFSTPHIVVIIISVIVSLTWLLWLKKGLFNVNKKAFLLHIVWIGMLNTIPFFWVALFR